MGATLREAGEKEVVNPCLPLWLLAQEENHASLQLWPKVSAAFTPHPPPWERQVQGGGQGRGVLPSTPLWPRGTLTARPTSL